MGGAMPCRERMGQEVDSGKDIVVDATACDEAAKIIGARALARVG